MLLEGPVGHLLRIAEVVDAGGGRDPVADLMEDTPSKLKEEDDEVHVHLKDVTKITVNDYGQR